MAITLNASTSSGFIQSADTSGEINLQSNGSTVLGLTSTGATVTGTQSISGNLSFNSGYGSSAVAYGCRAWVNFNGTTSPGTIRGSGNVSSVTKNGTGDYTLNFANAMPDANYSIMGSCVGSTTSFASVIGGNASSSLTTTTCRFGTVNSGGSGQDNTYVSIAVFR